MKRGWIAVLLLVGGCQTERLTPGAPVTLSDAQVAAVQGTVRGHLAGDPVSADFSLLRAAESPEGILVCGVVDAHRADGTGPGPLPFRAALGADGTAALLDFGGSRYRNEVIAARCGRSGISTQNLILLR